MNENKMLTYLSAAAMAMGNSENYYREEPKCPQTKRQGKTRAKNKAAKKARKKQRR